MTYLLSPVTASRIVLTVEPSERSRVGATDLRIVSRVVPPRRVSEIIWIRVSARFATTPVT